MKTSYAYAFLGALLSQTVVTLRICDIGDYNPFADGVNYDDGAMIAALTDCQDGGQILFNPGMYLLSPFNMTSNMELYLPEGAVLLASPEFDKWPVVEGLPSYPPEHGGLRLGAFIGSFNSSNITIRGAGTIDGQGAAWWNAESGELKYGRGRLIEPMYCSNFRMDGITVTNPPFWAIHPYACDGVDIENVVFTAPITSPNTDGIDPDSCTNVRIINFTASCGDDAIAIKSGKDEYGRSFNKSSSNILIQGGLIGPSSGIDIGSEMSGGVYNVTLQDVHFKGALFGLRIKSARGRGGLVRDVTVKDCTLEDVVMGLALTMRYADGEPSPPLDEHTPHFERVTYSNITGTALDAGAFLCLVESACRGITMENINITSIGGFICERVFGSVVGVVVPESCL